MILSCPNTLCPSKMPEPALDYTLEQYQHEQSGLHLILCPGCGMEGPTAETADEAAGFWNALPRHQEVAGVLISDLTPQETRLETLIALSRKQNESFESIAQSLKVLVSK